MYTWCTHFLVSRHVQGSSTADLLQQTDAGHSVCLTHWRKAFLRANIDVLRTYFMLSSAQFSLARILLLVHCRY